MNKLSLLSSLFRDGFRKKEETPAWINTLLAVGGTNHGPPAGPASQEVIIAEDEKGDN